MPYEFISTHQLLQDFWLEVDKVLNKLGLNTEQGDENT
jgi:hypothetical protein